MMSVSPEGPTVSESHFELPQSDEAERSVLGAVLLKELS